MQTQNSTSEAQNTATPAVPEPAPAPTQTTPAPASGPSERELALQQELERIRGERDGFKSKYEETLPPAKKREMELEELRQYKAKHEKELQEARLTAYAERRMRELGVTPENAIMELIGGSSEQEIDASIQLARSEFQRFFDLALKRAKQELEAQSRQQPQAPPPPPVGYSYANVPGPNSFARPVQPPQMPEATLGTQQYTEQVAQYTSPEAVRSGLYAKHRQSLMSGLRQQNAQMGGQAAWNGPRTYVSTVQQPQPAPMGPPAVPQQSFSPQAPQNLPPQPVHQQQPGGVQPPIPQPPPQVNLAGAPLQMVPDQLSQNGVINLDAVRQQAHASARNALNRQVGTKHMVRGNGDSQFNTNVDLQRQAAQEFTMNPDGTVPHGMHRTSA